MLDPQLSAQLSELGIAPQTVEAIMTWAVWLTVVSLVAAIPTGILAKRKGRSVTGWVLLELCIPVLPLILVWLLPGRKPPG